jgi:hypothetical protein
MSVTNRDQTDANGRHPQGHDDPNTGRPDHPPHTGGASQ